MAHSEEISWLDEVRDEVLEDQGLDEEDLPHLDEIDLYEIVLASEHIAALERRVTDEDADVALSAEVDVAWGRLREMVLAELSRLSEDEGIHVDDGEESLETLADAIAERLVAEAEESH